MKNVRDKFIVIIINWSLIGSRFPLAPYCLFSVLLQVQFPSLSQFLFPAKWEIKSILSVRLYFNNDEYFVPTIILSFSGARACVELGLYKEARSWLHMGLAVSFNECFKRDTRCNASNISREINTFRRDSSTHNPSNVLLYCTEQFKEAKIFLKSSFDYSTKLYSKEEAILINSQSLSGIPLIFVFRRASPWRPNLNQ